MRIAFALVAVGVLFVSGCKTTESASTGQHEIFVKVDRVISDNDHDGSAGHINIIIQRDGEEPIRIEGDPASIEVQEQLALLKAEGIHVMGDDHAFLDGGPDGKEHKWIVKHSSEHDHDGTNLHIEEGERIFIMKDGDHNEHSSHGGSHKKVIVIKGDTEEDVKQQLKEHGFDLEFDFELGEEETEK